MTASAIATFLSEAPTPEATRAFLATLGTPSPATVEEVCGALERQEARAHLEALGEAATEKALKKAARLSAHKLKSKGVASTWRRAAVSLTGPLELDRVAILAPVSLAGRFEGLLAPLPEAPGGMLDVGAGHAKQAETMPELNLARVRALHKDAVRRDAASAPVLAEAALAVRFVEAAKETLATLGRATPPAFSHFVAWAARARALGAGPSPSARGRLSPSSAPLEEVVKAVVEHPRAHPEVLPPELSELIDPKIGPELHSHAAIPESDFLAKVEALALEALDLWWTRQHVPAVAAGWLELGADLLAAGDDEAGACAFLAAADHIRGHAGPARTSPLLSAFVLRAVNAPSAWRHREAHIHGHAHH
jgi:hypothetical protein